MPSEHSVAAKGGENCAERYLPDIPLGCERRRSGSGSREQQARLWCGGGQRLAYLCHLCRLALAPTNQFAARDVTAGTSMSITWFWSALFRLASTFLVPEHVSLVCTAPLSEGNSYSSRRRVEHSSGQWSERGTTICIAALTYVSSLNTDSGIGITILS